LRRIGSGKKEGKESVTTKRFRLIAASIFGISVLILLGWMLFRPDESIAQDESALSAIVSGVLAVLASIAAPVCPLSAAGWAIAVILDARRSADSDSILDWRLE
jgi:hypothetical protein